MSAKAESLAPKGGVVLLGYLGADEQATQNFVDIMVKIHNKNQNIESLKSNKGAFCP